jgi:RNA polymerase sigma factor (sigma-70 family)
MIELDSIQRTAAQEVHRLVKSYPWIASHVADMQQEAIIALLGTRAQLDPAKGAWDALAAVTARRAVVKYLKQARVWKAHLMEQLKSDHSQVASSERAAEEQLDRLRITQKVRRLLHRLDYTPQKVGVASALKEYPTSEIARRAGVPVMAVYRARKNVLRNAETYVPLRNLWEELRP